MDFTESPEQAALREAVAKLAAGYGAGYATPKARRNEPLNELWAEAGRLGYLGVNLPIEFGGGGQGLYELSLVQEELSAQGCGLLMMVVSPAICGTIISRFGTDEQRSKWLPGLADGSQIMAFAITEADAGSNSHRITTTASRDGDDWVLSGSKTFISGIESADNVLVVARTEDAKTGTLRPVLMVVPVDSAGLEAQPIELDLVLPERQWTLFFDDLRLPADALVGAQDAAISQLFAGLNPERIMASAAAIGQARFALDRAAAYAKEREVWGGKAIGTHQGVAHPLAQSFMEVELAKLMMQKAATLYDSGDDVGAGVAANIAKYSAAEAAAAAVDRAIQTHGGNGLTVEYGLAAMLGNSRLSRIAPVSREMILNFVAQHNLGLPKSY